MTPPTEHQALLLAHALSLLLRNDRAGEMGEQIREPETQRAWYEGLQVGEKVLGQIGFAPGELLDDTMVLELMTEERLEWHRHRAAHAVQVPLLVLGMIEKEMVGRGMRIVPRTLAVVVERVAVEGETYRGADSVAPAGIVVDEVSSLPADGPRWSARRGAMPPALRTRYQEVLVGPD